MFCEYCAIKTKECTKIGKSPGDEQKVVPSKHLEIFRPHLVAFAMRADKDCDGGCHCCEVCLKQFQQCFAFVQQIQRAQQELRQKQRKLIERSILPKPAVSIEGTKDIRIDSVAAANTTTLNKKPRSYKCHECAAAFSCHRQQKLHEKTTHSSKDKFCNICPFCCSLFANAESLDKHQQDQHVDGRYLCTPCSKYYKNKGSLRQHVSRVHGGSGASLLFYCTLCPTTTMTASSTESSCKIVQFISRAALQQHFESVHLLMPSTREDEDDDVEIEMNEEFLDEFLLSANANENSFQFSECWDALDLHLTDILHNEPTTATRNGISNETIISAFKCPKCSDDCPNQKSLLHHLTQKHSLNLIVCNKCELSFYDPTQLAIHKSTTPACAPSNSDIRNCDICAKSFKSNAALNYHKKKHARPNQQTLSHTCPFCTKNFSAIINLKQHLRIVHSQLKRHTCLLCDKQFATLDHLKKHVLAQHQNERRHTCHVCAKRFTQLGHLKQHMAIHTTGKTLQCTVCETSFWRKIDMNRHIRNKHA